MSNFGQPIGLAPDLVPQEPARPQTQLPGIGIGIAPDLAGAAPQQADADRERQLLDAFRRAVNTDPTFEAEAMVHAKELGVARAAVSANPEIARRMVKQKALQYAELKRSFPTLLERFSDVEFASVAHDDLGNLKATESDFDWMRRQFGSGRAQTQRGYLGVRKALGWLTPEEQRDLDNVDLRVAGGDGKGFAASTLQVVGQMSDTIPLALGAGAAAGLAGSAAGPGGAATGFTIGSGTAAFTQSAMIEGGNAYLDMVDKGIDPETAAKAAFGVIAPLNGALELVGLKYFAAPFRASFGREAVKQLSKNLTRETAQSAFNKFAREYAKGVLGEVGTEALQELVTMAASNVAQSSSRPDLPEQTWGEMGQQVADVVAKTSQAMATIALPGPSLHLWADGRRAAAATHSAKFFTELSTKVKESKLRERAPDALHGFIAKAAEGGDASTIFVDAAKLQEVLRQQELTTDNLADLVPEVAKQVEAAAAAGEDVQVPTADFAMKLAGTKLGDALIPHMRLDPESRSLADAEVFRQGEKERSAEAQQILQQQEVENREFVRQAELVEGSLRQQLGAAGKMPANEAVAAAKFYRDIVVTQANRAGMLPEAFVAKYPLRVLASDAAAAVGDLRQGEAPVRDLIVQHNISEEKLAAAVELGGLPVPSLAIAKVEGANTQFGSVTLIGDPSLVDPESGVPVFDADAYTARRPELVYKAVPTKKADAFLKPFQVIAEEMDQKGATSDLWDSLVNSPSKPKAAEKLASSTFGRIAFLRERGLLGQLPMEPVPIRYSFVRRPALRDWLRANAEEVRQWQRLGSDEREQSPVRAEFVRQVTQAVDEELATLKAAGLEERLVARARANVLDPDTGELEIHPDHILRDFERSEAQMVDESAIRQLIEPHRQELGQWAEAQVAGLFDAPKVKVGGRLRPATLENIVDAMTSKSVKGAEQTMTFSEGKARAAMATRYRSLEQIRADRKRIVTPAEHAEQAKKTEAIVSAYRTAAVELFKGTDWRGNIDTWEGLDAAMQALADIGKAKTVTDDRVRQAFAKHNFRPPAPALVGMAKQAAESLRDNPVDYFEAKPQRAVQLREFAGAVVPRSATAATRKALADSGLVIAEYDDEAGRTAAVERLAREIDRARGGGLLFQPDKPKKGSKKDQQKRINRSQGAMAAAQTRKIKALNDARAGKLDLLAYIALNGGMRRGKTWPGSTLPEHLAVRGWQVLRVFSERAPMSWDQMARSAQEDGWFPGNDDEGGNAWSEEVFINAVGDALNGATILHPNAYTDKSGGGFESEVDRMRRELGEQHDQQKAAELDPDYLRSRAAQYRADGDDERALYDEMRADAAQAGRALPEDYYLDEMEWGERWMLQYAALLDTLLPDRQGTQLSHALMAAGATVDDITAALQAEIRKVYRPEAGAAAGAAEGPGPNSGATEGGSVADVPAGPGDAPAGRQPTEGAQQQPVQLDPDPRPEFADEGATDTPEGPASPSPDLVQPIIGDLGGIDPQTPGRGSYRPADFTIFLHRTADASTFLHELSHHYLHVLADLASRPNAAPAIAADMQQLLQWFGVADLATWNSLTLEQQRNHHEAFAYSFELYLFEGKSPSQALEGLFARFARWLRRAYTTIRGELNTAYRNETGEDLPALTPEVRAVMDRMVASDEEIAHQASVRGMTPQFATQAEAGMNDAEWLAYQELHQDQRDAASAQLTHDSMRQMQWLSGARAGLLRRMQQKHDALRAKVRDQVATTIEQRPVYRAIAWLRDGPAAAEGSEGATQADGESHRLASDAVRKLLPEGAKLGGVWRAITEKKGLAPDLVARLHGFRTGEDLVAAIAEAPALEVAIDAETDKRMLAEHSELADPQKRELAVQAALHNEARTRFLGAELRHLTKATQPVRLMVQAAKSTAARILAGKPVGQIQPREHVVAEERARRASIQAMRRGDSAAAGEQKRVELLQHHLAKGAIDAREEIDEALEQFEKLWDSDEKIGKARSIEHVAAARAILAHFGLARGGMKPAEHMAQAFAYAPEVAQELQPMVDRMGAIAGKNTWRSVTLDEFRTMREAVEQLWFQARRANEMVVEGRKVRIAAAAGELAARLEELGLPARAPGDRGTETPGEQFRREGVLAGFASLTRVEHWAAALGPVFTRYVFRPIADGLVNYRRDRNIYVQRYEQLLRAHREAGHLDLEDILAPELNGHIFHGKPELLGALLHTGNRSNLRKLVVGWKWHDWDEGPDLFDTSRWDKFQARMVQKGVLTKADFDFVQAVWDMNEGLKPQLQETHRGLFGHYFEEVEASEIATQWGVYRGGYVPATADSTEQGTALHKQLEELQGDYRNVVPAVQRGFTKSRTDITRRLTLDIRQMAGHLDKVLRFAHVQPAVRDVLAVLKHRDLAGTLHRWNPALMDKLLLPWLNRAASGLTTEPAKNKEVGRWLTKLRQNAGLAIMAGNVVNAAQNLAGILTARTLVSGRDLRASLFEVVGSPRETAASIAARSPFMANRMEGRIHELTSSIDELARGRGLLGKANELAGKYGYVMQKKTQGFVDQVVWIGAYNQAMREQSAAVGDKEAEATAVARADAVVRRTQGSQEAEDVSAYETGTPLWKAFVQFGSWFNNNANLNASEWVRLKRELGWRGVVGTRAGALALWGFLLPTLAASWIQQFLGAGWDDEDDDGMADEYVGWFFASQGRALLASVPMVGAAGLTAWNFLDDKGFNDRMPQPAVLSIPERGLKALMGLDGGVTGTRVRDVLTFASTLVGVPLTVVGRPLGYAMSVDEGKVDPTGPVDFARGLVTGQASAASKQ